MKIIQRPAGAALTIAVGVAAFLVGASLLMLRDGGWPWHASIGGPAGVGGASTAEIIDEDGTAYRFTGSPADAQHWLDRKQDELKVAHSVDLHGGWEPDEHPHVPPPGDRPGTAGWWLRL